ncbi:Hypothetical protein CM240_3035 [Clostridium bornimense]|uniref:Uncharacterized protein n=1 Tax=Clostridium bornimense TaxID=1216932 RepID=W6S6X3_9CLOT|nr:hypothetical protein [Clostridium bornimense]CDM70152.1 Hypothetical protein CM240_3035 [Clostridium bornimense]
MAKKTSKNNDLLNSAKRITSNKIYSLLLDLVNDNNEDLASEVLKIDYILSYASNCIKQKDFSAAKEAISKSETRIAMLKDKGVNVDHLEYLHKGIKKKCR